MYRRRALLVAVSGLLCLALTGCFDPVVPPEAVLRGTWELTGDLVSDLSQVLITFDADGQITEIQYIYLGVTVTINADRLIETFSDVDEQEVQISAWWDLGSTLTFQGTFNDDQTEITGTAYYRLVISPLITVEVPAGSAVLTRQ